MRSFLPAIAVALVLCVLALGAKTAVAKSIVAIEVVENTKTRDETVILIADVRKGDVYTEDLPERVTRDLVSSGLFKDVNVFSMPEKDGVKLTIVAKDKHSWIIAPTVYNQPTNKGGGVGFGENNLFGENKKLLLYGQVATGDSFFVGAYVDPSLAGSRFNWQVDVFLRRERVIEYSPPTSLTSKLRPVRQSKLNYLNMGIKGGITVFRTMSLDLRFRGAKVFYDQTRLASGAELSQVTSDPNITADNIPEPGAEGWDVSTELVLEYDRRANWYGISSGDLYRLSIERSLQEIGSDFHYWAGTVRFMRARKYFERHNLIIKGLAGYGNDLPFQREYTSGGTDLRGYKNDVMRGNFQMGATAEYSVPIFTIKGFALRALTFLDSTYTTFIKTSSAESQRNYLPGRNDSRLGGFKNSVGLGTRVYLRSVVLPLLGLDIGYGIETGATEIYFAIGLTDL